MSWEGVRILGNAGLGEAGEEPLDNELGQDDWAKPGSTEVVLMSGGRDGIGLRRVSCSPLWTQALWGVGTASCERPRGPRTSRAHIRL